MKHIAYVIILISFSKSIYAEDKKNIEVCLSLYKIAASAINNKEKGKTKKEMLAPLPSRETVDKSDQSDPRVIIAHNMHQIIDDVYDYETLPVSVYAPFTSEKCIRQVKGLPIKPYSESHPKLKKCALLKSDKKQVKCAFEVVNDA